MSKFTHLPNERIIWNDLIYQLQVYNENRFIGAKITETPKLPKSNLPAGMTTIPFIVKSFNYAYYHCDNLKVVDYGRPIKFYDNMYGAFNECSSLEIVGSEENYLDVENATEILYIFNNCRSLKKVYLKNLTKDLDISFSQVLELDSLKYLIENSKSDIRKTIKIDWRLFDEWTKDSQLITLAQSYNVSLAKN